MPDKWDKFIVSDPSAAPAPAVDKWEKFAVSSAPAAAPDPTALANQALAQNPRSAGLRVGRPAVTTPTPQNVPRLSYAPSANYYIPPNSRQAVTATSNGAIDALPGSFEGKPENVGQYVPSGPGEVVGGVRDVAQGNISRGLHRAIAGLGATMSPAAPFAIAGAPAAAMVGGAGGFAGSTLGEKAATALGATPDQSALAGDVGGVAGGYGAARLMTPLQQMLSRALLLGKTPQGAYQSAIKPSTTLSQAEREQIVNTGLREGVVPSKGGLAKISSIIDDLNQRISGIINDNPNVMIDPKKVASRIDPTRSQFATQVNPEGDVAAINAAKAEFLRKHTIEAPYTKIAPAQESEGFAPVGQGINKIIDPIPAPAAQAEKIGTYRALGDKAYGELKGASIEGQKALARGLKEELANAFPEIQPMNARESQLLDLQPVIEKAVARIGNHQILGLGTPAAAAAGKMITGSDKVAGAAAVMKAVLDNPVVKSRIAIAMMRSGVSRAAANQRIESYIGALAQPSVSGYAQPPNTPPNQ